MNTETVIVHQKGEDFEIIVQHDQSGSAYGIPLSKNAYEQLRQHFIIGSVLPNVVASERKLREVAELYKLKVDNGKSDFYLAWRLCYEWMSGNGR